MISIQNYIGGELVAASGGGVLDDFEPATGRVFAHCPDSDARDIDAAVHAARDALPAWSASSAAERSRLLLEIAARIEARLEEFAHAESIDTGKPIKLARALDIPRAVANFRFFATAILHQRGDAHFTDQRALNYTLRTPRGVAGLISPWNLPLYLLSWKIAPAIATGNTCVAKPSELTPLTAFLLAQVCREARLPAGVVNIVHGLGAKAGAALVAHPNVPTLSFTGGTQTGTQVARVGGAALKKLSLELGGKNPTLIFADADPPRALEAACRAAFSNQGQICLCGSRVLIERSIYDDFRRQFVERATALRCGDPLDESTDQGALASAAHLEKVRRYAQLALQEGGTILCGGAAPEDLPERCRDGYFFRPTVIDGLDSRCAVNQEEIFGPLVTLLPFESTEQAIALANDTPFGLSASIWTQNLDRAHHVAAALVCGSVWVNCWLLRDLRVPFGGAKQSGLGREGGEEALQFFTEPKNVCVSLAPPER